MRWEQVNSNMWLKAPISARWYDLTDGYGLGMSGPLDICRLAGDARYWLIPAEDKLVAEDQSNLIGPYGSAEEAKEHAALLGRFMPPVST